MRAIKACGPGEANVDYKEQLYTLTHSLGKTFLALEFSRHCKQHCPSGNARDQAWPNHFQAALAMHQ